MPAEELFVIQPVEVTLRPEDRPGRPLSRVVCAVCGEGINDRREVYVEDQPLCRACAEGAYYQQVLPLGQPALVATELNPFIAGEAIG
jgi:formylmethanofuran dehydrogenase subunit E